MNPLVIKLVELGLLVVEKWPFRRKRTPAVRHAQELDKSQIRELVKDGKK